MNDGLAYTREDFSSDRRSPYLSTADLAKNILGELKTKHGDSRRKSNGLDSNESLIDWGRQYLPDHFCRLPSQMHRWLSAKLDLMRTERGAKINLLGPRGAAKSTLATLAYPLRETLAGREPYVWIVSDTKRQAYAHLENVKAELLENERLAARYPQTVGRGTVWRGGSITLRNGATIEAFGAGQRLRGRRRREHRPTLIVCDDLQNDDHMRSIGQRAKSREWFHGMLMKAGSPQTNVVNLATALHREALAMELHAAPGWTSRIFRSIETWPARMDLWNEWESIYCDAERPSSGQRAKDFYEKRRDEMNDGARVLWPEVEDLFALMRLRAEDGHAAFEREKQNSPTNPDLCEWPESYFDDGVWFEEWPRELVVKTAALDPSKGADSRRGDYAALVLLGVDRQGMIYLDADLTRKPTPQIVADSVDRIATFRPDAFGVETNQFQDLLAGEFEAEFKRQGLLTARPWPIENRVNKEVRIRRWGPYLASRRVRFKSKSAGAKLLVDQFREFPIADHDDGPDAAEMALRLASQLLGNRAANDGLGNRLPVGE